MSDLQHPCEHWAESISMAAAGCLPVGEEQKVRRHGEACSGCGERLQQLTGLCGTLAGQRLETHGEDIAIVQRVMSAIELGESTGDNLPIVIDTSRRSAVPGRAPFLLAYFLQVGPFSYMVSALLMCIAVFAAWQYKMADRVEQPELAQPHRPSDADVQRLDSWVAFVTGMDDCQWAEVTPKEKPRPSNGSDLAMASRVSLGRQIKLDSGLFEITYRTGAVVVLQGPATFQIEANGGFLAVGRLTGRLEKTARETDSRSANASFVIRTPNAKVIDLGTEFGVEVDKDGCTTSYVFRGAVHLQSTLGGNDANDLVLKADEAGRVESKTNQPSTIQRVAVGGDRFARRIRNRRIPIEVFGTGVGVNAGQPDPHWRVVAAESANDSESKAAMVVRSPRANWYAADIATATKWISRHGDCYLAETPGRVYTFRTTFDLESGSPGRAVLRGSILADGNIRAIRFNGHPVPTPEQSQNPSQWFSSFVIEKGFVAGNNTLEFDVETSEPFAGSPLSALGLRVELEGSVLDK